MRKVISAVLAGAMLATSVGVAAPALAEEAAAPAASVQKSSVNAVYNQYLDVLQRYKTAQDNGFYQYPNTNNEALWQLDINNNLAASSTKTVEYALVDLQKDGIPELIIATHDYSTAVMPYNIYDIFCIVNDRILRPIKDFSMGYKSWYTITENGYLDNISFAGAKDEVHEFISIEPATGIANYKRSIEYVSWNVPEYYATYGPADFTNRYAISKSEYETIKAQYPWKQNITWHPIDDYASLWSELNANTIPVFVDGIQISFDQQPIIQDDRTLVPLRGVFEALGATVYWNNDTRSVTAYKDDTTIELAIGSSTMYVNGQPKYLDVAGQIINDRTMVPLRAISEAFGAIVYWDNDTRTVRVYSDESTVPSDPDEPDADNPEINDPTEPENPDEEEPVDPEIPGTDEPTEPVDPEPPAEEPDNPVVEPEDPEVDTPEEEQPSEEDQQKNVEYNAALLQLQSGYSYDAYYGFKALGDYKDSAELMDQAYWLNILTCNANSFLYHGAYDMKDSFRVMSDTEIKQIITQNEWISPFMQSVGYEINTFDSDGTGTCLMQGHPTPPYDTAWILDKGGLFSATAHIVDIYGNHHYYDPVVFNNTYINKKEFCEIIPGVYVDIVISNANVSSPGPGSPHGSAAYVDLDSNIGQGLKAFWDRYSANPSLGYGPFQQDTNGLWYKS